MTGSTTEEIFCYYRGRVALYALLRALDLKRGDEVLLQAFTCLAVPSPVVGLGLRPVYLDITKASYNLDPDQLEGRITNKAKAIIVQHTFGIPAEMDAVLAVAKAHNLAVIEDCAHVLGSKYRGTELGNWGDAAFCSYEWGKPLVVGLGGAAVVHSPGLADKLRALYGELVVPPFRDRCLLNLQYFAHALLRRPALYWMLRDIFRRLTASGLLIGNFGEDELAGSLNREFQWKMGPSQARRLIRKLRRAQETIAQCKRVAKRYETGLRELGLPCLDCPPGSEAVLLLYPMWAEDKPQVLAEARRRRIELRDLFVSPIHPLAGDQWKNVGYVRGMCPVAEEASRHVVSLPVNGVRTTDVDRNLEFLCNIRDRGLIRRSTENRSAADMKELTATRN